NAIPPWMVNRYHVFSLGPCGKASCIARPQPHAAMQLDLDLAWLSRLKPFAVADTADKPAPKLEESNLACICLVFQLNEIHGNAQLLTNFQHVKLDWRDRRGSAVLVGVKDQVIDLAPTLVQFMKARPPGVNGNLELEINFPFWYRMPQAHIQLVVSIMLVKKVSSAETLRTIYERTMTQKYQMQVPTAPKCHWFKALTKASDEAVNGVDDLQEKLLEKVKKDKELKDQAKAAGTLKLAASDDIELGDTVVSFQCPLTLSRMAHPAKGRLCTHSQLFDALSFLQFTGNKAYWSCVVCRREIKSSDLLIDAQALRLLRVYKDADKCVVKPDGTDEPFKLVEAVDLDKEDDGKNAAAGRQGDDKKVETISLLDDDDVVMVLDDPTGESQSSSSLKRSQDSVEPSTSGGTADSPGPLDPKRIRLSHGGTMHLEGDVVVID
ncbi:SUMO ligase siz1, partial [Chytridiales sp. JEL 0842]